MNISEREIKAWVEARKQGLDKLKDTLPDFLADASEPVFNSLLRVLDFIAANADTISDSVQLIDTIITFLNARQLFGASGEAPVLPREFRHVEGDLAVLKACLVTA